MRFLHAADIHLDSPLAGLRQRAGARGDELAGATRRAFQNLVQFAIDQKVELLLIAGDNYDGRHRHYGSVLFFAREMERLQRAGVRVVLIRGNHDAENQMELRLPAGVRLLSPDGPESVGFEDLGVVVHGQSYPRRDVRHNLVATYPDPIAGRVNIGLLHTAVDGFGGTHERYAPCTVADLIAKNYDYWALGHVHERTEIATAPWIVYPGNLQARKISEAGSKGATLVTVTGGRISDVKAIPFDVARWTRLPIDVSSCEDIDEVSAAIDAALATEVDGADGRALVARLEIIGRTPLHRLLKTDPARLDAEAERAAEAAGDVWIEQIQLMTEDTLDGHPASADALVDLVQGVKAIRANAADREMLRESIGALPKKLSVSLQREIGLEAVGDETLDRVIDDARDILLSKLMS
ncbi:MAG TPA: DNA repair exonuclease [Rhizomicrobium sp.]|jgi:DNA repair exonuclease SbcCD nuclease subunit